MCSWGWGGWGKRVCLRSERGKIYKISSRIQACLSIFNNFILLWQDHTHPITTPTRLRSRRADMVPRAAVVLLLALWLELLSSPSLMTVGVAKIWLRVVGEGMAPVVAVGGSSGMLLLAVGACTV